MHHKKRRPWAARASCGVCHWYKDPVCKGSARAQAKRVWIEYERRAEEADPGRPMSRSYDWYSGHPGQYGRVRWTRLSTKP